jgi:hypothetical protein
MDEVFRLALSIASYKRPLCGHLAISPVDDILAPIARSKHGIWHTSTTVYSPLHQDQSAGHRRFHTSYHWRSIHFLCLLSSLRLPHGLLYWQQIALLYPSSHI